MQGLTNYWVAQPAREDPCLYLAGEWEVAAPRQGLLCLPPLLGCPACPFHPAVLLASCLGEQESFFLLSSVGCGLAGCISWLVSGQGDKACLEKGSCFGS